jgi:hypothetical protein
MSETEGEVQEQLERRDGRPEPGGEGRPDTSPRESNRTPRAQSTISSGRRATSRRPTSTPTPR